VFDNRVIDGAVDGFAATIRSVGSRLRGAQRGALQENLTVAFGVGAVLVVVFLVFFNAVAR
jgi:multicomponent Na+:H+ antiporter subunit D